MQLLQVKNRPKPKIEKFNVKISQKPRREGTFLIANSDSAFKSTLWFVWYKNLVNYCYQKVLQAARPSILFIDKIYRLTSLWNMHFDGGIFHFPRIDCTVYSTPYFTSLTALRLTAPNILVDNVYFLKQLS